MKKLIPLIILLCTLCTVTIFAYDTGSQDMLSNKSETINIGQSAEIAFIALPRLSLTYYFIIALALTLAIGIAWLLVHKGKKLSLSYKYIFFAPIAYMAGQLLIKRGFNFVTFSLERDLVMILLSSACIYGIIILGLSLIEEQKLKRTL